MQARAPIASAKPTVATQRLRRLLKTERRSHGISQGVLTKELSRLEAQLNALRALVVSHIAEGLKPQETR
jgi:hypothetical protein